MSAILPGQGDLFPVAAQLDPSDAALAAEALSYTLAQLSRGCPYAPEWSDADIVERAGPLLGRLRA